MKNNIVFKTFLLIVVSIIAGTLLMIGIYALPVDRVVSHVEASSNLYEIGENKVNNWVGDLRYGKIDNSTDFTMLNTAMCREYDSLIENAMLNPRWSLSKEATAGGNSSNIGLLFNEKNIEGVSGYSRYWHGYLLYLIPCLNFFSVGQIRVLMMVVQFSMAVILLFGIGNRLGAKYMIPYMAAILFINPITTALNMQNADIVIIAMFFSIVIIYFNDWLVINKRYILLFSMIGICTAFFDFLTYPVVGFAMPMFTYVLMNRDTWINSIFKIAGCAIAWGFSYAGMWLGKWVVADLLTSENVIANAISAVGVRSGVSNVDSIDLSYGNAMFVTKESFWDPVNAALCLLYTVVCAGFCLAKKEKLSVDLNRIIPLLLITISFFVWVFLARNHYVTHQFLEYRSFAVVVLGFYLFIVELFNGERNEEY